MSLKITLKAGELQTERTLTKQQARRLHAKLWAKLRTVSFAMERKIKSSMPVDTGRARASWGRWSPGSLRKVTLTGAGGKKEKFSRAAISGNEATHADAVWKMDALNLSIEQGSNVDYIERLNAGHSKQAPKGFIDSAELDAVRVLDNEVSKVIAEVF